METGIPRSGAGNVSPTGDFLHQRRKSPKTPLETHGFKASFARYTPLLSAAYTARSREYADNRFKYDPFLFSFCCRTLAQR